MTVSRRSFLTNLGHGALLACAGSTLADELGAATRSPRRFEPRHPPRLPSDLEQLVTAMRDTAPELLMQRCVKELASGTSLSLLTAAGALANARVFGGEDYEGYHAEMALLPALHMSKAMPQRLRALPVLKVLYRNTARIHKAGGGRERMRPVAPIAPGDDPARQLRQSARDGAMLGSERLFAGICTAGSTADAFAALQPMLQDDLNVHRIVLCWRSWDMLPLVGDEHAQTMLGQFVRFCVDHEQDRVKKRRPEPAVRRAVPKLLDQHQLIGREPGTKKLDDTGMAELVAAVFRGDRERAADAVAASLAAGYDPEQVGEAISLAANELLLHDTGKERVHGASVGVHASDAANAWRNIARVGPQAHRTANLLVGAFHTGGQSQHVGDQPYAYAEQQRELAAKQKPGELIAALQRAIEARDQRAAMAAAARYGELALPAQPMFDALLRYACSEDGALHAEKYYWTVREEYDRTRHSQRWRRVIALARVTASECGERAPGYDLARSLLET